MHSSGAPYDVLKLGRLVALTVCGCLSQCVEPYVSPYKSPPTGYLVVEGYISANSPTQYTLTRTVQLSGNYGIPAVTGAMVQVEGSDSSVYPLTEQGNGVYGNTTLALNPAFQYRLRIQTPNGESYASDFVQVKPSPAIDSINWIYSADSGVNIYLNTHDPNNATHYYQWTFDQTWEYDMPEVSYLIYDDTNNTVISRQPNQFVNRCWENSPSTNILLGNTSKLAQDVVYQFPLVNIPLNSQPLSVLYTIHVTQYALTADGYNFLYQMLQNTEALGTIFDAQPTELMGNIHCLNNAAEPVIGYVSAGTVQQERIWIASYQLPVYWLYLIICPGPNVVIPNIPDSIRYYFGGGGYIPLSAAGSGYLANFSTCVDCTLLGGSNQKPSFWPN
jgi:Domain of unknown function (DUF4249)